MGAGPVTFVLMMLRDLGAPKPQPSHKEKGPGLASNPKPGSVSLMGSVAPE